MQILKRETSNTLLRTELWTVQPDGIGYPFLVYVTTPMTPRPEKGWAAVLATDGNYCAGTLAYTGLWAMAGEMPATVTVAVGYPLDSTIPAMVARNRELTPVPWPEWDAPYGELLGAPAPPSGSADAFVAFVHDELMPFIEREVGVDPSEWTLAGHSFGGLFATYALLSRPGRCRRYLAVVSSFWWKKTLMFDRARAFAQAARPLNVSVYLAAGDHETTAAATTAWHRWMDTEILKSYLEVMRGIPDIVAETREMAAILAQRCGVRVRCDILDEETHSSASLAAFSRGLRWLHKV
jgi:predicted alpha/beta superfamily hydrolase